MGMKRLVTGLTAVLLVAGISACGGQPPADQGTTQADAPKQTAAAEEDTTAFCGIVSDELAGKVTGGFRFDYARMEDWDSFFEMYDRLIDESQSRIQEAVATSEDFFKEMKGLIESHEADSINRWVVDNWEQVTLVETEIKELCDKDVFYSTLLEEFTIEAVEVSRNRPEVAKMVGFPETGYLGLPVGDWENNWFGGEYNGQRGLDGAMYANTIKPLGSKVGVSFIFGTFSDNESYETKNERVATAMEEVALGPVDVKEVVLADSGLRATRYIFSLRETPIPYQKDSKDAWWIVDAGDSVRMLQITAQFEIAPDMFAMADTYVLQSN
jgi:hypothetical protein